MSLASLHDYKTPRPWLLLLVFLVVVLGIGGLIGTQSAPGEWYQNLQKPPFNPPNWLFGPAWGVLYVLIAIAGWRIWMIDPRSNAMKFWFAQMVFNWAWTPTWFVLHLMWPAFAVITIIWLAIIGFMLTAWRLDRPSALLFVPYFLWVSFAAVLNFTIAVMN